MAKRNIIFILSFLFTIFFVKDTFHEKNEFRFCNDSKYNYDIYNPKHKSNNELLVEDNYEKDSLMNERIKIK